MYKNTGGKLVKVSDDLHYIKIQLLFNYKTRNYVGTIYGGHMYSSVDGIYVIQLIHILGDNYIVWDKSAIIKFKRPANKTLFADFKISDELIEQIKKRDQGIGIITSFFSPSGFENVNDRNIDLKIYLPFDFIFSSFRLSLIHI